MSWLPFPFPECPSCRQKWAYSYHHDCPSGGQIEVNPDSRQIRCQACIDEAGIWDIRFICACRHSFGSMDVQAAIDDIVATASLFAMIVEQNKQEAAMARALGEESLRKWIGGVAITLGGHLGGLLGKIAGSFARFIFG